MSFFCLLWVPFFYFFRRSLVGAGSSSGGVWALILGSITAIIQFFLGDLVNNPGGFGYSRMLFGFIDIVSLTVLIPLFVYFLMVVFRGFSGEVDFANFALLWMIPVAALRSLSWSSTNDPILLILVPLLWTALAAGIPFFVNWLMDNFSVLKVIISVVCVLILPFTAAAAYWAFFSQQTLLGYLLLAVTNIPLGFSIYLDISRS